MADEQHQIPDRRTEVPLQYPHAMQNDHDAIVTLVSETRQLRTEVREIKTDIKDVKTNVSDRVRDLEQEKLDKVEAERLQALADEEHDKLWAAIGKQGETIEALVQWKSTARGIIIVLGIFGPILSAIVTAYLIEKIIK